MKKTLLAIAVGLSIAGTAAATDRPDVYTSANSGAYVSVGGVVSSSAANGTGGSAHMSSTAASFNGSGSYAKGGARHYGSDAHGRLGTGAITAGGAITHSEGVVSGTGQGVNSAYAEYHGDAEAGIEVDERGFDLSSESYATTAGSAGTIVYGTGSATQFTASGAGNLSHIEGAKDSDYDSNWFYMGRGKWLNVSTQTDSGYLAGGTIGGAGSISGGRVVGDAAGSAGSGAYADGSVDGRIVTRRGDVKVNGDAEQYSFAQSSNAGTGLAGAGNYSYAGFEAGAVHVEGELALYKWCRRICGGEYELAGAYANDYKGTESGSFALGGGTASADGAAAVNASAQAGDRIEVPTQD